MGSSLEHTGHRVVDFGSWILKRCRPVVVDGVNSSHWWIDHWRIGRNDGSHVNLANGGKIRCLAGRGNGIAALPRWQTLVGKNEEEYWFKTEIGSKLLLVGVSRRAGSTKDVPNLFPMKLRQIWVMPAIYFLATMTGLELSYLHFPALILFNINHAVL